MPPFSIPRCLPQTGSFYLACAIIALIAAWLLCRLRARQRASLRNAILAAQLSERERIARALHDSWLQNIHGLVLSLASSVRMVPEDSAVAEHLRKLLARSDEVMLEGRQEIMGLRNSLRKPADLHDALEALGARLQRQFGVTFVMEKKGLRRVMSGAVLNEMYYLGSEALHNAFRHAKASRITLTLDFGRELVVMSVADNGVGIPRQVLQAGAGEGHWGLVSMHERAGLVGGELALRSGARGTEVCLSIPMAA